MSAQKAGIRARPGGRWQISWYAKGVRHYKTLASYQEARTALTKIRRELDTGTYQEPVHQPLRDYLASYLRDCERTGASQAKLRTNADSHRRLDPYIGHIKLSDLTGDDIAAARDALLEGKACSDCPPEGGMSLRDRSSALRRTSRSQMSSTGSSSTIHSRLRTSLRAKLSPKTVKDDLGALRVALNAAVTRGLLTVSPMVGVRFPRASRPEIKPLTAAEAARLLAVLRSHDEPYARLLAVGLLTGLRTYSEWGGMRRSDVDLERGVASLTQVLVKDHSGGKWGWRLIQAGNNKHKRRQVEIPAAVVPIIREQLAWADQVMGMRFQHQSDDELGATRALKAWQAQALVFCDYDGDMMPNPTLQRASKRYLEEAGLPRSVRIHDLRHTWATLALRNGVHAKVVQASLGHSSITMTMDIYSHVVAGQERAAMDVVAGLLEAAV